MNLFALLFVLHLIFAIWGHPLLPANIASDGSKFVSQAAYLNLDWEYGSSKNYSRMLSLLFTFTGSYNVAARVLSSIGFYVFLIYLQKILNLLNVDKQLKDRCVLFIVLNPAFFIYTSAALREVWLIALMAIGIYYSLLYIQTGQLRCFGRQVLAFALMGWLHKTYSVLFIPFVLLPSIIGKTQLFYPLIIVILVYIAIFLARYNNIEYVLGSYLSEVISGDIIYRWYSTRLYLDTRTDASNFYGVVPESPQIADILLTIPIMFVHYLIAPLSTPTLIDSLIDYGYSAFSILRLILILAGVFVLLKEYLSHRLLFSKVYLWLFWFISVFLWSIGTANYGTALRHNITTDWLLVVLIVIGYAERMTEKFVRTDKRSFMRNTNILADTRFNSYFFREGK